MTSTLKGRGKGEEERPGEKKNSGCGSLQLLQRKPRAVGLEVTEEVDNRKRKTNKGKKQKEAIYPDLIRRKPASGTEGKGTKTTSSDREKRFPGTTTKGLMLWGVQPEKTEDAETKKGGMTDNFPTYRWPLGKGQVWGKKMEGTKKKKRVGSVLEKNRRFGAFWLSTWRIKP